MGSGPMWKRIRSTASAVPWAAPVTTSWAWLRTPRPPRSARGPARPCRWARREIAPMAAVTLDITVEEEVARAFRNSTPRTLQTIQQQGQLMVSNVLGFVVHSSARARNHTLYEEDFYDWTQKTAALFRERQWYDLDLVALAEEVEEL